MTANSTPGVSPTANGSLEASHKLPAGHRYLNLSTLWIPYFRLLIRAFYRLHIRHEVATALSIGCGLAGAWVIAGLPDSGRFVTAAVLVHLKDVFDATDGALARLTGTGHRFGRFLDTVGDGVTFTGWIAATALVMVTAGTSPVATTAWAVAGWLSLFLQCSYYNFHHLHAVRVAGARSTSRLDEQSVEPADRATAVMAAVYRVWFGWQDRLVAWFDRRQRVSVGLPEDAADPENDAWYRHRGLLVANSALCFGTHTFVLVVLLLARRPEWFLPAVAIGMNAYLLLIVAARRVVFRRDAPETA